MSFPVRRVELSIVFHFQVALVAAAIFNRKLYSRRHLWGLLQSESEVSFSGDTSLLVFTVRDIFENFIYSVALNKTILNELLYQGQDRSNWWTHHTRRCADALALSLIIWDLLRVEFSVEHFKFLGISPPHTICSALYIPVCLTYQCVWYTRVSEIPMCLIYQCVWYTRVCLIYQCVWHISVWYTSVSHIPVCLINPCVWHTCVSAKPVCLIDQWCLTLSQSEPMTQILVNIHGMDIYR